MRYIVGLLSVMLIYFALTTPAVAATSIEGSWIGSGTVSRGGNVDRVQCRVRYTKSSKNSYASSSVCTTENGRYDVSGHVQISVAIATEVLSRRGAKRAKS